MRWSWKILTLWGVDISIHATFLLLLAFVAMSYAWQGQGSEAIFAGVSFVLLLFLCVLLHELGHAMAARRFGIQTRDITLLPIGGVSRLERMPERPLQEVIVALAGPSVNALIAVVLLGVLGVGAVTGAPVTAGSFLSKLCWANILLCLFNLLPAFPMDGGRILRAILALRMSYVRATQIAATVGQATAFLFAFLGLFANPFLIFIALFVYLGASEEAAIVQMRASFRGIPVQQAMLTSYRSLSPTDRLSQAVDQLLAGSQQDFPVVEVDRPIGVLTRSGIVTGLEKYGPAALVSDVMNTAVGSVDASEMLDGVFQRMKSEGCSALPVTRAGKLVGLLTLENVGEFVMVQSALRKARSSLAAGV